MPRLSPVERRPLSRGHHESFGRSGRTYHASYQPRDRSISPATSFRLFPVPIGEGTAGIQRAEHCSRCSYRTHVTRSTRPLSYWVKPSRVQRSRRRGDRRRRMDLSTVSLEPEQRLRLAAFIIFIFEHFKPALFSLLVLPAIACCARSR